MRIFIDQPLVVSIGVQPSGTQEARWVRTQLVETVPVPRRWPWADMNT